MSAMREIRLWQDANPLRVWRKGMFFSLRTAAVYLDYSVNTIQDWEQGAYAPRPENVARLEAKTGITESDWAAWRALRPDY